MLPPNYFDAIPAPPRLPEAPTPRHPPAWLPLLAALVALWPGGWPR